VNEHAEQHRAEARRQEDAFKREVADALYWLGRYDVDRAADAWERAGIRRLMARIARERADGYEFDRPGWES
jgi:hypothetical protein